MTSISAFSEILMEGDLTDEERQRYSRVIHDEAMRLTRLLDALLDLNVLEQGAARLVSERGLLRDIIERAVLATSAVSAAGTFTIDRNELREAVEVTTDLDRLAQVFINLIGNARRYADHVWVQAGRRDDAIEITVDDDGPGIPASSHEDVFRPFFRLEGSRNRSTGASGD